MKNISVSLLLLFVAFMACTKMDHTYKEYLNDGEIIYPGVPFNLEVHPGRRRLEIQFTQSGDPNIVKYKISWNNNGKHLEVPADKLNKIQKVMIADLAEGDYTFGILAVDKSGNTSTPRSAIISGRSLGDIYESNLAVRPVAFTNSQAGMIVKMLSADASYKYSIIDYEDGAGNNKMVRYNQLPALQDTLEDIKKTLRTIKITSAVVPEKCIDTFYAVRTMPLVLMAADYVCTGSMIDYTSAALTGPYPWNVTLRAVNPTQLELVDNDQTKDVYHKILNNGTASSYGEFGVVINLDVNNNVVSVINKYGQPSSNGRSAELDPSGENTFDPVTKVLKLKYWMNQPGSTHRTLFDETFIMK